MYIEQVELKNFQAHEHTVVNLTNGINVLVGSSNSGKSSWLRGLRWNLTNQPSGDEFIKIGSKEAYARVKWSDGHEVIRVRSKGGSKNTYTLLKDGEVVEEYTGFGTSVPPHILEVTGINPSLEFNFANQLEGPFLLSQTPKVRAEKIGNLEELGKIDSALTELNDDVRLTKKEQKEKGVELAKLEKEKNELAISLSKDKQKVETLQVLKESVLEQEKLLKEMERLKPRLSQVQSEYQRVKEEIDRSTRILAGWDESLPKEVESINRLAQLGARLLSIKQEVGEISFIGNERLKELEELTEIITTLSSSYQRIVQLGGQMQRIQSDRSAIGSSFSNKVSGIDLSLVDKDVERFTALFHLRNRLTSVKGEQKEVSSNIERTKEQINSLLEQFVEALQQSEVCPICFQDTHGIDKHIIQEAI